MVQKPNANGGLCIFGLRRKRILFAAACILLFAVIYLHVNRAQANPIVDELSTLALADQNGSSTPDFHYKKLYTLDITKSLPNQATVTGVTYNGTSLIPYERLQTFYMPVTSSVYQADLNVILSDPLATFDISQPEGVTRDLNRIHIDSLPYGQWLTLALTVHSVERIPSQWTIIIGPPSNEAELDVIRNQSPAVGAVVPFLRPIDHMWFEVALSTLPADAAIYYTVDGSDPALSSELYDPVNKPRLLPGQTLKAIGVKQGMRNSPMLVLTGPELEYPGSPDISYILNKINDRVDVDGGGFGKSDVEYWLGKIKPVKVVPVLPPAG